METLNLLLVVLAGIQICDIAIALTLYFIYDKQVEYLYVIAMWIGMLVFFLMDTYLGAPSVAHIFFSYSFVGISTLSIGKLISRLFQVDFTFRKYLLVMVACYGIALIMALKGIEDFTLLGAIVSIGLVYPVFSVIYKVYLKGEKKYSLDNIFLVILFIWGAHFLDYPFLRPVEDVTFSIFGFSFALLLTYLTSVMVPVIVNRYRHIQLTAKLRGDLEEHKENLKVARDQIIAKENLANLGQLTAGIAHEIKNPINIILNSAHSLGRAVDANNIERTKSLTDIIERNSVRADEIIKSILAQSAHTSPALVDVDLNALIRTAFDLVQQSNQEQVVEVDYDFEDLPAIKAYKNELQRSIINLIENSFKAVRDVNIPKIEFRTYQDGSYSVIVIRDNGTGINPEIRKDIYQPFYTTRPAGEGTGLGLSMVHDIVRFHNGTIEVDSKVGEYTEFTVKISNELEG